MSKGSPQQMPGGMDRDVDPRLFRRLPGQGGGAEACFPISISPVSPPQGELNGQRGLVPSNFLEGPGPEAGSSHREPGTPPAESQVSEDLVWGWREGCRGCRPMSTVPGWSC